MLLHVFSAICGIKVANAEHNLVGKDD